MENNIVENKNEEEMEVEELSEESRLEKARKKLSNLKEQSKRLQQQGLKFDPHLLVIEPENLTSKDLEIFEKLMNDDLTEEEFKDYEQKAYQEKKGLSPREILDDPTLTFIAWLRNQLVSKRKI